MKSRLLFLAVCVLVAGIELLARDVPQLVEPLFTELPPLNASIDVSTFEAMQPAPGNPTSTLMLSGDGRLMFVNPQSGVTTGRGVPARTHADAARRDP